MKLTPGDRLDAGDRNVFEILGEARRAGGYAFHHARKPFWNFRERDRSRYEAGPGESLSVLVRVPLAGDLDTQRRRLDFELEHVLAIEDIPWLPEPIDRFEVTRDGATAAVLVLADPHADPPDPAPAGLLREILALLDALHARGLSAGEPTPADFVADAEGRWTFLGTGGVRPSEEGSSRRDLIAWAALAWPTIARFAEPGAIAATPGLGMEPSALAEVLRTIPPQAPLAADLRWVVERLGRLADAPESAGELLRPASRLAKAWRATRGRPGA